MTVPSYEDLARGIPDEVDAKSVGSLASLLELQLPVSSSRLPASGSRLPVSGLFACVRLEAGSGQLEAGSRKLEALLTIARDFSPRVMVVSEHEVLLDVSGLGRLIGEPPEIERQLARAMYDAGLTARAAIATTQTIARLLAAARPERPGPRDYIADLDVTVLQPLETLPPAMNHRDRARPYETFQRWGIATLGDLVALPAADLSSRLGRRGVALQRLARGLDPRPFVPDAETPRYIGRLELEWPLDTIEPLSFVFARLLDPLSVALERADRGAAAIRLDLRLTTRETHTRVLQLPAPMRDPKVLRTLLLLDLESPSSPLRGFGETSAVTMTVAVDAVAIELDPAPARITQFSLLERALPSPETLSTLTARLSALVGESRIGSAVLVDTHRPGAFAMERFAPEATVGRTSQVRLDEPGLRGPAYRNQEAAVSRVSEMPVLRRQRIPPAIRVSVEHGRPVYIAAARRGMPQGAVTQAAGPWRTSGDWWSGHWDRDEWDVALKSGAVCRIFQDRTTGCWFLEGTYD